MTQCFKLQDSLLILAYRRTEQLRFALCTKSAETVEGIQAINVAHQETKTISTGLSGCGQQTFLWAAGCGQQTFLSGCRLWTADIFVGLPVVDSRHFCGLAVVDSRHFCWAAGC